MKFVALALLSGFVLSASAYAQTCASPTPIPAKPYPPFSGTTCGGTPGLNLGGTVYSHPSVVYSFVANAQAVTEGATLTFTGADREASLVTSCNSAPITSGAPGFPLVIPPGSLNAGTTYLIIVSSDTGIAPTPPICGTYGFSVTGTLPVALQNFSVE